MADFLSFFDNAGAFEADPAAVLQGVYASNPTVLDIENRLLVLSKLETISKTPWAYVDEKKKKLQDAIADSRTVLMNERKTLIGEGIPPPIANRLASSLAEKYLLQKEILLNALYPEFLDSHVNNLLANPHKAP